MIFSGEKKKTSTKSIVKINKRLISPFSYVYC